MNRKPHLSATVALAAAIFAVGEWEVTRPAPVGDGPPVIAQADRLIRARSPVMGPKDATVTIVEFFDPACEACRAFHPIVKDILAQYPENVRVVPRYTPFHEVGSEVATGPLEAARLQGVFIPVLEALPERESLWASHGAPATEGIMVIAGSVGLNVEATELRLRVPDNAAALNQDRVDVEAVGVRQTPTFLVNGKPIEPFGEAALRALAKPRSVRPDNPEEPQA